MTRHHQPYPRVFEPGDMPLDGAGFAPVDLAVLTIARHFFQSFAAPESQSWLRALAAARDLFPEDRDGRAVLALASAIDAMRHARRSGFRYSSPDCRVCSSILCESERQFISVFRALRLGRISEAHAHALLLCEGQPMEAFIAAMRALAEGLDASPAPGPRGASSVAAGSAAAS